MKIILYSLIFQLLSCALHGAEFFDKASSVKAYVYDYTQLKKGNETHQTSFIVNGTYHSGLIKGYTKTLTKDQVKTLKSVVLAKKKSRVDVDCIYSPHHSFVFYDKNNKILGNIDVCFQCGEAYSSLASSPHSRTWDWVALSKLVKQLGLPILQSNKDYTKLFNKSGQNN